MISPEYKPRIVSFFCASDIFSTVVGTVVVVEEVEDVEEVVDDEEVDEIEFSEIVSF